MFVTPGGSWEHLEYMVRVEATDWMYYFINNINHEMMSNIINLIIEFSWSAFINGFG